MDASKLTEMRMQAANTYKSNWQPRDASEVTYFNQYRAQKFNSQTHQGPISPDCCQTPLNPNPGFTTNYALSNVVNRVAGCVTCSDSNFGAPGGVQLITCEEAAIINTAPPNPVKGSSCYCADPGLQTRTSASGPFTYGNPSPCNLVPGYTGFYPNVPVTGNPATGVTLVQYPPYPSG